MWLIFPNLSNPNPGVIYMQYMHISAFWHFCDCSLPPNKKKRGALERRFPSSKYLEVSIEKGIRWKITLPYITPFAVPKKKRLHLCIQVVNLRFLWGFFFSSQGKWSECFSQKKVDKKVRTVLWQKRWLGGGFKDFFMFTPIWGRFPIWRAYVSKGLNPPPMSIISFVCRTSRI